MFIVGILVFLAIHFFTALARPARAALIGRMGEGAYKGAFSLLSALGLALIYMGWSDAPRGVLYTPPYWLRHATYLLVLISFIFVVAAYLPSGRIASTLKHPMLAGVKVWAFAHLLSNGDVRSVILFGGVLAFAVVDRIAVKKRGAPVPQPGPWRHDGLVVGVALVAYAAVFFYLHRFIAGVPLT